MSAIPTLTFAIAARLMEVPGVVAVALGGSAARGEARPDSDLDLGLYYDVEPGFDLAALAGLCRALDDSGAAQPSAPGGWGPWVDGGAWLTVGGQRVDVIYRELGRVAASVEDALAGRVSLHAQPGHPHGIHGHHYAAELALGAVLLDPSGRLAALGQQLGPCPQALRDALARHYSWQPLFWLEQAGKGLKRGDLHYAQGCAYQAVMARVQTLCAQAGLWLTNEKGALARAARSTHAPPGFEADVQAALRSMDLAALRRLTVEV